ncbi:nitrous oxide reductase family maturation protein NosD [Chitinophaga oryziterrae]|uniref:Nitrous oxide reductase family maturation protein NosD n=1 Tax=Chitinophaga oryziterrae TaxID=1031224 RepID=A0A6N8JAX1_9BACT|nr:nitrous oxide reductase family maturation protein NosD [Chitinophaga oryziterrae]MVT42397.1 nitrous oxide reductase family maturation protein NosD [Chitinophaga oryziterrae]
MKRVLSYLLLHVFLLSAATPGFATIIKVHPAANSIHHAADNARSGDTLLLQKGIYREHDIIISKKLTITGEGFPVIDGESKYQVFIITSDSVIIQGLQIQHIGKVSITDMAGIRIVNAKCVTIKNNRLINNTFGIYLQNATRCYIVNNMIHSDTKDEINGGNGIHAWKSTHLSITGNSISGHRDGIYFEFVTDSYIAANTSFDNARYGLHFMFSHNDTYTQNTFKSNGAGVAVMYSKGVIMHDNEFVHNWGDASYGLLLKEITDSKIEHNRFTKNTVGIHMEGTTRVDVRHNIFEDNGWGVRVQASCSGSNFVENNFIGNSFDVTTNGSMMLNVFNNNYWDKYDGYDLDKNNIGDVSYYPVSVYAVITEKIPPAMILYRSFLTDMMDQVEKVMPTIIPDMLKDDHPLMKKLKL